MEHLAVEGQEASRLFLRLLRVADERPASWIMKSLLDPMAIGAFLQ
jgi:hypothetical protein